MFPRSLKNIFKKIKTTVDIRFGFTLAELLIVIFIVCFLTAGSFIAVRRSKERAYLIAAKTELTLLSTYVHKYYDEFGEFPPDENRNVPAAIRKYFDDKWPRGIWPGSVYDWDNWTLEDDEVYPDGTKIYQISIRFCDMGQPDTCRFPHEPWAENFQVNSAVYYCISGPCRAHRDWDADYPAYRIN